MRKAKRNEVPKEYRRNRKKEFLNLCAIVAISFATVAIILLMLAI